MFFTKTTNSKPKRWHWLFIAVIIIAFIGVKIRNDYYAPKATVRLSGRDFTVLVADTPARRHKGWSNKISMGKYGGMLFIFEQSARYSMVMRDMFFPLDIVWLNEGAVIDMAPNVLPQRGAAEAELIPYFPRLPADMALELPAGFISGTGLKIGDKLEVIP